MTRPHPVIVANINHQHGEQELKSQLEGIGVEDTVPHVVSIYPLFAPSENDVGIAGNSPPFP